MRMQAEHQKGDEIEESRPAHGITGRQHPGGDDGGDGIGRIVQTIEKIEEQRDGDEAGQQGKGDRDLHRLDVLDDDAADLVGDVLETVDHLLQLAVDLAADQECHGVGTAVFAE